MSHSPCGGVRILKGLKVDTRKEIIIMVHKICIFATEVAKLANMHKYESREKAISDVLKRYKLDPSKAFAKRLELDESFIHTERERLEHVKDSLPKCVTIDELQHVQRELHGVNESLEVSISKNKKHKEQLENVRSIQDHENALTNAIEHIHDVISKTVQNEEDTSIALNNNELRKAMEDAVIHTDTENVSKDKLYNALKGEVACRMGKKLEEKSIKKFESKHNVTVEHMQTGYKSNPYTTDLGNKFVIYGRTDGLTDEMVIESKNRKSRFLGIPLYESVQLHVYMHLTNRLSGKLLENFDGVQKEHILKFDYELWEQIMKELSIAVDEIFELIHHCFEGSP